MGYGNNSYGSTVTVTITDPVYRKKPDPTGVRAVNVIQGYEGNDIANDLGSCTISGGGQPGFENIIGGSTANVGTNTPNLPNLTGTGAHYSVIGGGYDNVANGLASVLTGFHNIIESGTTHGTISGGAFNNILTGEYGFIGGGNRNNVRGSSSVISGGTDNDTYNGGAVVAGGTNNKATGNNSVIGGGNANKTNGQAASVVGGANNEANADYASVGGGSGNIASGLYSTVSGGMANLANANQATVVGGLQNQATNTIATVIGGQNNKAKQLGSTVLGGRDNEANGLYSVAMGRDADAANYGQKTHASGKFAVIGDAQVSELVMRRQTVDATPTLLCLDGASILAIIKNNSAWLFEINLIARSTAGDVKAVKATGVIKRDAANSSLVGTPTITTVSETSGASSWAVEVLSGTSSLQVRVTGEAEKTINWVAKVSTVEVIA